jgi:uncharacterized membrane protein YecN with MAPEG domain
MAPHHWFNLFVFLNVLILTILAINISRLRIAEKVPHGDGDNVRVKKAIRAHGNGIEHVVVFALMILALDSGDVPSILLAALVWGFTLGRLAHAAGMLGSIFNLRRLGASITYLLELVGLFAVLRYGVLI